MHINVMKAENGYVVQEDNFACKEKSFWIAKDLDALLQVIRQLVIEKADVE